MMYGPHGHLTNHIDANPPLVHNPTLHVILVISNYERYQSRYRLFRDTYAHLLKTPHVKVYVVEAAFGARAHEVTTLDPTHLQVRTKQSIWIKENLINLGIRHLLPRDWKYVAWIDADVEFRDDGWALEAMQKAQQYAVLQPWQSASDLGPFGGVTQTFASFGYLNSAHVRIQTSPNDPYRYGHSGFAWVARRDWYEAAQGLFDKAILGSGDHHMAWACVGNVIEGSVHQGMSAGFKRACLEWQDRVVTVSEKRVGFSIGRIEHSFHGPKKRRMYRERWQILIDHKFDPYTDLRYDDQGVLQLVGKTGLLHAIEDYNRGRHEDSIEEF